MAEYRRSEIISGLFVCLAFVIFGLFAFRVGRFDFFSFLKRETLICVAYFTDVQTLAPGQPVKVGGQPVGEVTAVRMVQRPLTQVEVEHLREFHEEKAAQGLRAGMVRQLIEVQFELSNPRLKLNPETASVTLGQASLLSSHFVELDPGEWMPNEEPLTIFEAEHTGQITIAAREGTGYAGLVAAVKPVVKELRSLLSTVNESILSQDNVRMVEAILENLDGTVGQARALAVRMDDTLAMVQDKVLTEENASAFQHLLTDLDGTTQDARRVIVRIGDLFDPDKDPRIDAMLTSLGAAAQEFDSRLRSVQSALEAVLRSATGVLDDNRAEVAEAVRRLRRTLWHAELAMRKIRGNPAVLLFGDEEIDYNAQTSDESTLRYTGRASPYGQRDEGAER
jgi:ABC-type transporter Mla subunit MlaD